MLHGGRPVIATIRMRVQRSTELRATTRQLRPLCDLRCPAVTAKTTLT